MRALTMFVVCVAFGLALITGLASSGGAVPNVSGPIALTGITTEHHPGSTETWYWSLKSIRRRAGAFGYAVMACISVSRKTTLRQCTGTFVLPRGRLSIAGTFLYDSIFMLAVTGGTADYTKASGVLSARQLGANVFEFIFSLK